MNLTNKFLLIIGFIAPGIIEVLFKDSILHQQIWAVTIIPIIYLAYKFGTKGGLIGVIITALIGLLAQVIYTYINSLSLIIGDMEELSHVLKVVIGATVISILVGNLSEKQKRQEKILKDLLNIDSLTNLYNHRYFHSFLNKFFEEANNENAITLIFCDIDDFRFYNNRFGHIAGDSVLEKIGQILKEKVNGLGEVFRYGGEEFAILIYNSDCSAIFTLAEDIKNSVMNFPFEGKETQPKGCISISIGFATYPKNASNKEELFKKADQALYEAKYFSKNKIEMYYSALDNLIKDSSISKNSLTDAVKTFLTIIDAKDRYTYGHSDRVMKYATEFANELGIANEEKELLFYSAYLHDVGKIEIEKNILNKVGPLDDYEWEIMKQHPEWGGKILLPVERLQPIIPIIQHHHERFDGKGYPMGLKEKEIPYLARVLSIVDSFDAMTSKRPYREAFTKEAACLELKKCAGTQFDPELVEAFIIFIEKVKF